MNKLSEAERNSKKKELEVTAIDEKEHEQWRAFHIAICDLQKSSPYEGPVTSQLMSQLQARSNDIWEALRRCSVNIEEDRGIPIGRITRKEMATEGHITLIYRNPADGLKYLFREGDNSGSHLEMKNGKITTIKSMGLQPDGSILVPFKGVEHRELRNKISIFRRTSISPDDDEDDGGDHTPPLIAPVHPEELVMA